MGNDAQGRGLGWPTTYGFQAFIYWKYFTLEYSQGIYSQVRKYYYGVINKGNADVFVLHRAKCPDLPMSNHDLYKGYFLQGKLAKEYAKYRAENREEGIADAMSFCLSFLPKIEQFVQGVRESTYNDKMIKLSCNWLFRMPVRLKRSRGRLRHLKIMGKHLLASGVNNSNGCSLWVHLHRKTAPNTRYIVDVSHNIICVTSLNFRANHT